LQSKRTVRRLGLTLLKACWVLLGWVLLASGAIGCDNPSQQQLDAGSVADGAAGTSGASGAGGMTLTGSGGAGGAGGAGGTGGAGGAGGVGGMTVTGVGGAGGMRITGIGGSGGSAGTGGAGLDLCSVSSPNGTGGNPGGFVDAGPFQFVAYDWSSYVSGFGIGPGTTTSARIQADGTVAASYGCLGHAPADVLATFIAKATSPAMVAPFLCDARCEGLADGSIDVTLTLANRTTFKRSITCDGRIQDLINAAAAVFKAACASPDAGADATPH
jgi:hypothetical protein